MLKLAGECIEGQLADHIASLDAHTRNLFETGIVGNYYNFIPAENGGVTLVADGLYLQLMPIARNMSFDRVAIYVQTGVTDSSIRLGLYKANSNLYPGSLVQDFGTVSSATTGLKTITIDSSLSKGLYFIALISDDAPTLYGASLIEQVPSPLGMLESGLRYWYWSYSKAAVGYGTLADPCVSGASLSSAVLAAALRLIGLD